VLELEQVRVDEETAESALAPELGVNEAELVASGLPARLSLDDLAAMMWSNDYVVLFMNELQQYSEVAATVLELVASIRSHRRSALVEDRAALLRLAAVCSALARERSRKIIPLSVAARSISWLMQRVPSRVWADERRRKQIVHRAVCHKLLDRMLACRPSASFQVSIFVNFVYGDQTYKQRGSTRRAERLEFMGSNGLPLNIEREVVFNSVHFPVPTALLPQLDAHALTTIHQRGVYSGAPFMTILPHLHPTTVQASLDKFLTQQLQYVSQFALTLGKPITMVSSAEVMDALVGRPLTDPGGATYFNILPTLRDCDTKSYDDGYLSWEHFQRCLSPALSCARARTLTRAHTLNW